MTPHSTHALQYGHSDTCSFVSSSNHSHYTQASVLSYAVGCRVRDAAYWIVFGSISLVHRVLTVDRECCPPSLPAAQVVRACYTDTDIRVKIRPPACRNSCLLAPRRVPIGLVSDSQQKAGSNRMHAWNHVLICTVLLYCTCIVYQFG